MPSTAETDQVSAIPAPELRDAVLAPVRGRHAFEACVEQLAGAIRLGVYPRGSSLPPERDLAERLGVSRATLREAIAALRAADFVETRRGRNGGTVISYEPGAPSAGARAKVGDRSDYLRDVLVYRRIVEPGASHLAAGRELTERQRAFVAEAHDELAGAADTTAYRQADSRFHLAIATVTESALIMRAVAEVQADLHEMLALIPVLEVNIEHSTEQHRTILNAILKGEATKARRVMESHCDDTAALLRGLLT